MKEIPLLFSLMRRASVLSVLALICLLCKPQPLHAQVLGGTPCVSSCPSGSTCGTYTIWDIGKFNGFSPQSIVDDVSGISNQVGAPAMVTSMENNCSSSSGLLYWNPSTNKFKEFCVANGFQFSVDLNRSTKSSSSDWYQPRFGSGDVWATVNGNAAYAPYMNFRGSSNFTRWDGINADSATGIRVNAGNGKVYFGNYGDPNNATAEPAEIIELDPATNKVRKWRTGNRPYQLWFDGTYVWATAVATTATSSGTSMSATTGTSGGTSGSGTFPDQILRLNPAATSGTNLTRWNLPVNGSFQPFDPVNGTTNPDHIVADLEGKVWFTETPANKIGRLDLATNKITEYTKKDVQGSSIILGSQNISSSGIGSTLQAFFTEDPGNALSVLTNSKATSQGGGAATPVSVVKTSSFVSPATSYATPRAFTVSPTVVNITPEMCQVVGQDPSGIFRFPTPNNPATDTSPGGPFTFGPTGITRAVIPHSVFGSLHGSSHVFKFSSSAIIAPPPSACREEDGDWHQDNAKHDGGKAHGHKHHTECEDDAKQMAGDDEYQDPSSGVDFRSTQYTSVTHDDLLHSVTVTGLGTNNGLPVAFTIIAVDSTLVPPGSFTIILSDGATNTLGGGLLGGGGLGGGYTNSGPLSDGSILLNTVQ